MWKCKKCSEKIESRFDACWSCGTSRDGVADPSFQSESTVEPKTHTSKFPTAKACSRCGARKVIPAIQILDQDGDDGVGSLSVAIERNPSAWIFKGTEVARLFASVCGACGFTELYTRNHAALWAAYEEQGKADN